MEEQGMTSRPRNAFRMLNNVWRSSQYSIKTKLKIYQGCVMSSLLYGSECWRMTESVITKLSSTQRTTEESCKSFCPIPSPTYSYSPAAIKTACWPLTCEGDGDGSDTSWGESRTTSLVQPFIRHLKESTRGDDRETADAELWRQRSRPCNTLGVPSRS